MRILVVEDEARIAADIAAALDGAGFLAEIVDNGEAAWFRGDTEDYAAAILDLGLPGMDGLSVLKRWRAAGRALPVVILTARGNWSERVEGIDAGADDYLPKPFRMEELLARLRAVLRRAGGNAAPVITAGALSLDTKAMKVTVDGRARALTPLEYRALHYLLHHRGRVVSQFELAEHLYGQEDAHGSNALEVLIGRLRRKLAIPLIETRRGQGYIIEAPAS